MLSICCSIVVLTAALGDGGAASVRETAHRSASLAAVRVADALPTASRGAPPSARLLVDGYEPSEGLHLHLTPARHAGPTQQRPVVADELAAGVALSGLTLDATGLTLFIQDRTGRTRSVRATFSRRGVRLTVPF